MTEKFSICFQRAEKFFYFKMYGILYIKKEI